VLGNNWKSCQAKEVRGRLALVPLPPLLLCLFVSL